MNKKKIEKFIKVSAGVLGTAFVVTSIVGKKKSAESKFENEPDQKNSLEGKKVIFVENEDELENADGARGHLEAVGNSDYRMGFYEKYIKRGIDIVLSFGGLVVLSPLLLGISLAIKIDDPGPVLFTQKRMGQNKKYFKLHKFRSMKMSTPHDVPTHMLDNPDQYITKVGKFLRAHSLDELPQIWDIFIGNMSVIGPRPGLWNQDILTAERDKYNANDVKPGLTGWAQINGRDELEIPDKAKLDGEYVSKMGLMMDIKCFLGSVGVFAHDDSVVEGGTGEMKKVGRHYTDGKSAEELIGHIGFGETVEVDTETKKRVLITGAGSYIGETFKAYAEEYYPTLEIDAVDMLDPAWREKDFSEYDIIYHVAGIAHADVGNVDDATKEKYYAVNTDLAVEVCEKAKREGAKEFIFMSSMIVYGDSAPYGKKKVIDEHTVPVPANFYGDSKLQADVAVRELADDKFKVIVLRPPMIYGEGSKGNYPVLVKLAKKLPIFPDIENHRSMLYIDNLCEFLCQIMLVKRFEKKAIVLVPQNKDWICTSNMVREIAKLNNKKIYISRTLSPAICLGSKVPGKTRKIINKAFGNFCYEKSISIYEGINYQNISKKMKSKISREREIVFSVITICYNSEDVIRKTIESVLAQTYANIEYIIVDGKSTDKTIEIAKEYEGRFLEKGYSYKIISEEDNGIYDAMNKGIRNSSGELIGLINAGDWYETAMVETAVDLYNESNYDVFFADINLIKKDGSVVVKKAKLDRFPTSRHWNHPTMVVKKSVYEELGVYRCKGIHDDFDFFLRSRRAHKKIVVKNIVLANFSMGGTSNEKSLSKCKKRCLDRYRCYRNNGYSRLYLIECLMIETIKFMFS